MKDLSCYWFVSWSGRFFSDFDSAEHFQILWLLQGFLKDLKRIFSPHAVYKDFR
jgi:hypothetical protein